MTMMPMGEEWAEPCRSSGNTDARNIYSFVIKCLWLVLTSYRSSNSR